MKKKLFNLVCLIVLTNPLFAIQTTLNIDDINLAKVVLLKKNSFSYALNKKNKIILDIVKSASMMGIGALICMASIMTTAISVKVSNNFPSDVDLRQGISKFHLWINFDSLRRPTGLPGFRRDIAINDGDDSIVSAIENTGNQYIKPISKGIAICSAVGTVFSGALTIACGVEIYKKINLYRELNQRIKNLAIRERQ